MNLAHLVEMNLGELIKTGADNSDLDANFQSYRQVLISYFRSQVSGIEMELNLKHLNSDFRKISLLRLEILKGDNLDKALLDAQKNLSQMKNSIAKAELLFCLSIGNLKFGSYQLASQYSLHAEVEYEKNNCFKKATKSFLNYIVSQSHIFPESRLFTEYHTLLKKAEACQEWGAAAIAELNIARELHRVGALELSLKSSISATTFAEKMAFGSREHGLSLLQTAHVLFELNRRIEAEHHLGLASLVDHPEVHGALQALQNQLKIDFITAKSKNKDSHLLKRWQENLFLSAKALGPMESQLVATLKEGPKEFHQLAEILFADVVDPFSQKERLKNLLSRVRKKHPGLIVYETGLYLLSDIENVLQTHKKVK